MKRRLIPWALALLLCAGCAGPVQPTQSPTAAPQPSQGEDIAFTRDNFPRLDGSTSTAPLGRAIAAVLLGESEEEVADLIQFSRTTQSYRNLMAGERDLVIAAEPNADVFDEMEQAGFEIQMEPFAQEALVFVVNAGNPVDSLTLEQIQGIYTGQITNWSQVGGADLPIAPFQRDADSGSQVLMEKLVMDGLDPIQPPEGLVAGSMDGLITGVMSYDNSDSAIGYTVYYYAHDMEMAQGLKILRVEGVSPSADTIRAGEYPLRNPYYVAMDANTPEQSMTAVLYRWLLGEDGQRLVARLGYASMLEVE